MLRKVWEFGSVCEHVCQLLTPKVVDLEVILGGFGWSLEVVLGVSREASWRSIRVSLGRRFRSIWVSLGGLLEVDLELVKVSFPKSSLVVLSEVITFCSLREGL